MVVVADRLSCFATFPCDLAPAPLRVGRDVPRRRGAEAGHEGPAPGGTDGGRAVDGLLESVLRVAFIVT